MFHSLSVYKAVEFYSRPGAYPRSLWVLGGEALHRTAQVSMRALTYTTGSLEMAVSLLCMSLVSDANMD